LTPLAGRSSSSPPICDGHRRGEQRFLTPLQRPSARPKALVKTLVPSNVKATFPGGVVKEGGGGARMLSLLFASPPPRLKGRREVDLLSQAEQDRMRISGQLPPKVVTERKKIDLAAAHDFGHAGAPIGSRYRDAVDIGVNDAGERHYGSRNFGGGDVFAL